MQVSECCGATFYEPGYPDNDICSDCREHSEPMEEDDPPYEKPNLIQQRISRDDYKHGWRKELSDMEDYAIDMEKMDKDKKNE